jgi:hypothetical protein
MPCRLHVTTAIKRDILDCNPEALQQIGDFLIALQEDPLPKNRQEMGDSEFYFLLPSGFYVSWEIVGNLMRLALTGETEGLLVRILGVARVPPK